MWSGSLSFGLINIPVKLYSASQERALSFRLLDKHGHCPISYARVCRATNKEVPYEDIVKGYEYQKGDYVILTDEDFRKASPRKTKSIDILHFVDEHEVPSEHIEKPYFIEPDVRAEKAYVLLREALRRSGKAGIGTVVFRNKERLVMIRPHGRALMLIQLRYQAELRTPEELHLPEGADYSQREVEMAVALIEQLAEHFDASAYKDTYTEELKKVIARKAKGKPIKVTEETEPVPTDMRDIMETLRKSLAQEKRTQKRPRTTA